MRIKGILRWDGAQNFGWATTADGRVFHVRRKNFRQQPTVQLQSGMTVEFSKLTSNAEFLESLYEGTERDTFSGSHRNPRPSERGGFGKHPLAVDVTIVQVEQDQATFPISKAPADLVLTGA
jgi:hypothetical protein